MKKNEFDAVLRRMGMTRKSLAEKLGIPIGTVNNWVAKDKDVPYLVEHLLQCMIEKSAMETIFLGSKKMFMQDALNEFYSYSYRLAGEGEEVKIPKEVLMYLKRISKEARVEFIRAMKQIGVIDADSQVDPDDIDILAQKSLVDDVVSLIKDLKKEVEELKKERNKDGQ
jgi:DNA-binding XRE family transcriptional regulator